MKKFRNLLAGLALAGIMVFSSCTVTLPVTATSNPVGSKVGVAKATGYLGPIGFGIYLDQDASIQTAAKNGGIKKISTVDMKVTNMLGLIYTYETIVTGE